ncbi:MAG: ATP-binding cassette domain-containing protein [Phycisphaeraceae bacterium]
MVSQSSHPVIQTRGLTKVFKDFWMRPRVVAVDSLDLSVDPHQVFGLLGPNGSGKSTAIKIILGLLFPTKGRVTVFDKLPNNVASKRRIGYLPEESYLYRFLNARETLEYYGRLFHLPRRDRSKRIDMLLEMVGLDAVQRRPVGEYSKGMQRRIGLAQALINDPDLLILDEPTTGLDPIGTRQIKDLILELKRRGKTVLLCSHLLADVEDVCDRVTVLYGGKKRAEGTVDELLTVSDSTLLETDTISPETIAKIERLIEQEEGKSIRSVEAPRQKLEALFLSIVQKAQAEGAATSGARTGGPVAEFLARDAHMPEAVDGKAIIDQLMSVEEVSETPDAPGEDASQGDKVEAVDDSAADELIQNLTRGEDEADSEAEPAGTTETTEEVGSQSTKKGEANQSAPNQSAANQADRDVIDDLLGGDGKS